jgi:hypothetical protein
MIRTKRDRQLAAEVRFLREKRGLPYRQIAARLRLADATVENAYWEARRWGIRRDEDEEG